MKRWVAAVGSGLTRRLSVAGSEMLSLLLPDRTEKCQVGVVYEGKRVRNRR